MLPAHARRSTSAGIGANPANAQTYRPDAEGYPCARTAQLAVVQSETGFSIREKADRAAPPRRRRLCRRQSSSETRSLSTAEFSRAPPSFVRSPPMSRSGNLILAALLCASAPAYAQENSAEPLTALPRKLSVNCARPSPI
jgi:hypothetical protein